MQWKFWSRLWPQASLEAVAQTYMAQDHWPPSQDLLFSMSLLKTIGDKSSTADKFGEATVEANIELELLTLYHPLSLNIDASLLFILNLLVHFDLLLIKGEFTYSMFGLL